MQYTLHNKYTSSPRCTPRHPGPTFMWSAEIQLLRHQSAVDQTGIRVNLRGEPAMLSARLLLGTTSLSALLVLRWRARQRCASSHPPSSVVATLIVPALRSTVVTNTLLLALSLLSVVTYGTTFTVRCTRRIYRRAVYAYPYPHSAPRLLTRPSVDAAGTAGTADTADGANAANAAGPSSAPAPFSSSSASSSSSSSPPPAVLGDRALISVIVPCRNEAAAIRLTLCRIVDAAADPSCLEIVVVDGGSRDGTVAMAQSLRGEMLRRVRSFQVLPSTGFGRGATLNTGAAASRGVAAFLGASGKETATATRGEGERGGDEKNGNHGEGTADTGNTGDAGDVGDTAGGEDEARVFREDGVLLFVHADTLLPEDFDIHVRSILQGGARSIPGSRTGSRAGSRSGGGEDDNSVRRRWGGAAALARRIHPSKGSGGRGAAMAAPLCGAFSFEVDRGSCASPSTVPAGLRILEIITNVRASYLELPYGDQALFLRVSTFEAVGRFPELPMFEDYALMQILRERAVMEGSWVEIAPVAARCSCKRWEARGVLHNTVLNQIFIYLYHFGMSAQRIYDLYYGTRTVGVKTTTKKVENGEECLHVPTDATEGKEGDRDDNDDSPRAPLSPPRGDICGPPTIILVAKAPLVGFAKTRLAKGGLGEAGAAEFAARSITDLVERIGLPLAHAGALMDGAQRHLLHIPDTAEGRARLAECQEEAAKASPTAARWNMIPARGGHGSGGLGEVLENALETVRSDYGATGAVLFLGMDTVDLSSESIVECLECCALGVAHIVRSVDGGYVLLGLPAGTPSSVFRDIPWSDPATCAEQRRRVWDARVPCLVANESYRDVDEPEDLEALKGRLLRLRGGSGAGVGRGTRGDEQWGEGRVGLTAAELCPRVASFLGVA